MPEAVPTTRYPTGVPGAWHRAAVAGLFAGLAVGATCSASADDAAEGRALAEKLCAHCHAIEGPGPGPNPEAPLFSRFTQRWPLESLAEAMAEGLTVGHGPMPDFVFTDQQVDDLLAYLASVQD